jgi:phosphatidylinositol alpha-1,6-mannosyltransferase
VPAAARAIVLTPLMGGADGISEMTRQWVQVLESHVGCGIASVDVWSLDDHDRPESPAAGTTFRTARGGRLRFSSFAVSHAGADLAGTLVVVMHLQLLPVALPLLLRGARLVVILMGIEAWKTLRPLERAAMQRAWKIVAISAHTAERFRRANPSFARTPIVVCAPGAPRMAAPAGARLDAPYALIVGRMDPTERYKGHDTLIEMWPRVRATVADARLVVAGDGDDMQRLRQKAAAVCPDGITFTGRVDANRLAALYRDATCFVMPSTDEGFGLVYLEAMAASVPCIAAHGAAEEIITDGHDGVIIDAADHDALVSSMVRLFEDSALRQRMANAALERVRGEFGAAALASRVSTVLELAASAEC